MTKHLVKSYKCAFSESASGWRSVSFMMFEKSLLEEVVDVRTLADLDAALTRVHAAAKDLTPGSYRTTEGLVRGERAISGYRKRSYASLTRECDRDTTQPEPQPAQPTPLPKVGDHSPWDTIDHVQPLGPCAFVSTPGHGGLWVPPELMTKIPVSFRQTPYSKGGWFEEDCDWCIPYLFLDLAKYDEKDLGRAARWTMEQSHPDALALLPAVPETETVQLEDGPAQQALLPGVGPADPPLTQAERTRLYNRAAMLPPPADGLFGG